MTKEIFKTILDRSIKDLHTHDKFLLNQNYDINERSISHKLATYISNRIKEFDLDFDTDIEYNRMSVDYNSDGIDVGNIVGKMINFEDHPDREKYVYPDIIIHKRNEPINVAIIEIKLSWKSSRKIHDYQKINQYLKQLEYQFGTYIELGEKISDTKLEFGPFELADCTTSYKHNSDKSD